MQQFTRFVDQAPQILAGADAADGAGQDVIEKKCGNRKPRNERSHRIANDHVDAASDKHAAAFHVNGTDCKAKQHDGDDVPGSCGPDGLLDDAADVINARAQIIQNNRCCSPKGNEGQHDGACDDDLGGGGT